MLRGNGLLLSRGSRADVTDDDVFVLVPFKKKKRIKRTFKLYSSFFMPSNFATLFTDLPTSVYKLSHSQWQVFFLLIAHKRLLIITQSEAGRIVFVFSYPFPSQHCLAT